MGCFSSPTQSTLMPTPQLYRQLQIQLSRWITPKDKGNNNFFMSSLNMIHELKALSLELTCGDFHQRPLTLYGDRRSQVL